MPTKAGKLHPKKDLRNKLSIQLHMILAGFKDVVDEKKLHKLVKKAGKLLADGLHHKSPKKVANKPAVKKTTAAKPVASVKKASRKKAAPAKKAAKKK